jgi:hypothetical protein
MATIYRNKLSLIHKNQLFPKAKITFSAAILSQS